MNKQRKILLGVVVLGIAAVLVDRVVLSDGATDPASAQAGAFHLGDSPAAQPSRGAVGGQPIAIPPAPSVSDGPPISQRLREARRASSQDPPRDAFTTEAAWAKPRDREAVADPGQARSEAVRAFESRYRLLAVMGSGESGVALIRSLADQSDHPLPVGGEIGGFKLLSVTAGRNGRAAIFDSPNGYTLLTLNDKE